MRGRFAPHRGTPPLSPVSSSVPSPIPKQGALDLSDASVLPSSSTRRRIRRLLLVNGSAESRIGFTRIARRWRHVNLFLADGGKVGMELALTKNPHLIVLDAQLPDADASRVVRCLRESLGVGRAGIIVLGVDLSGQEQKQFLDAGADYYFTRPLNLATVENTALGLLELAALR